MRGWAPWPSATASSPATSTCSGTARPSGLCRASTPAPPTFRTFARVLVSPLQRAKHTAELAGLGDFEVEPLLREWDYGAYEGVTTAQISADVGHPWEVFVDGVKPGVTPGETIEQVAERAQQVIEKVWPSLQDGNVALFGHGHALRVLTAVYLGVDPRFGQQLVLDAGSMSVLTHHRSTRCIGSFNLSPWRLLKDA